MALIRIFEALRGHSRWSMVAKALSGIGLPNVQPSIRIDGSGVGVALDPSDTEQVAVYAWSDIKMVVAFKRDLLTADLLCLRFETDSSAVLEVNEDMGEWSDLLDALPEYLPGCMTRLQVLEAIAKPAFATNETILYNRP